MFLNVYYLGELGLKPDMLIADTSGQNLPSSPDAHKTYSMRRHSWKHKFRGTSAARQWPASARSAVVSVESKTADEKVAACPQSAAVDVVASMHSYAMPSYIHRPIKFTARHTAIGSASCADDKRTSSSESSTVDAVKQPVSFRCLNV